MGYWGWALLEGDAALSLLSEFGDEVARGLVPNLSEADRLATAGVLLALAPSSFSEREAAVGMAAEEVRSDFAKAFGYDPGASVGTGLSKDIEKAIGLDWCSATPLSVGLLAALPPTTLSRIRDTAVQMVDQYIASIDHADLGFLSPLCILALAPPASQVVASATSWCEEMRRIDARTEVEDKNPELAGSVEVILGFLKSRTD